MTMIVRAPGLRADPRTQRTATTRRRISPWSKVLDISGAQTVKCLFSRGDDDYLYAGTGGLTGHAMILRSLDGSPGTWAVCGMVVPPFVTAICAFQDMLFLVTGDPTNEEDARIYLSWSGAGWVEVYVESRFSTFTDIHAFGSHVYAGGGGGIIVRSADGFNWEEVYNDPVYTWSCRFASLPGCLCAAIAGIWPDPFRGHIVRSTDGIGWQVVFEELYEVMTVYDGFRAWEGDIYWNYAGTPRSSTGLPGSWQAQVGHGCLGIAGFRRLHCSGTSMSHILRSSADGALGSWRSDKVPFGSTPAMEIHQGDLYAAGDDGDIYRQKGG